ncbi:hypothetical protein Lser_V15G09643 [Lactuca serriola]
MSSSEDSEDFSYVGCRFQRVKQRLKDRSTVSTSNGDSKAMCGRITWPYPIHHSSWTVQHLLYPLNSSPRVRLQSLIGYGIHGREKKSNYSRWVIFGLVLMNGVLMAPEFRSKSTPEKMKQSYNITCRTYLLFKYLQAIQP